MFRPYSELTEGFSVFRIKIIRGQGIVKITRRDKGRVSFGSYEFVSRGLPHNDIVLKFWAEDEDAARKLAAHICTADWDHIPNLSK